MATGNFKKMVYATKIQTQLDTITSLKNHCDFMYEGDTKYGERLKILGVSRPTSRAYVPGVDLVLDAGQDASQFLDIDQASYINVQVSDIEKAQGVPGKLEALSKEAVLSLSEDGDIYVGKIVKDNIDSLNKSSSTDISGVTDGGIALIESGFRKLYENNCKPTDEFYLEITPEWHSYLRPEIIALDTNNSELIRKGFVGKYGNALVSMENLLPTYNDGTRDTKLCMLRTSKAIAFASSIDTDSIEAYRPEKAFSDAIKILYVFGAKIVRPEQLFVFPIY